MPPFDIKYPSDAKSFKLYKKTSVFSASNKLIQGKNISYQCKLEGQSKTSYTAREAPKWPTSLIQISVNSIKRSKVSTLTRNLNLLYKNKRRAQISNQICKPKTLSNWGNYSHTFRCSLQSQIQQLISQFNYFIRKKKRKH